jgi:hypothetical protein
LFAGLFDARAMWRADETFIVRVRRGERGAVVEQPRLSRRRRVRDVSQVGALILGWLGWGEPRAASPPAELPPSTSEGDALERGGAT